MPSHTTRDEVVALMKRKHIEVRCALAAAGVPARHIDDAAETVFLTLAKDWDRVPSGISAEQWVMELTRRAAVESLKKHSARSSKLRETIAGLLSRSTSRAERLVAAPGISSALAGCLSKLPFARRELIDLRHTQELDAGTIARANAVTVDDVHDALHRTRAGLRDCMAAALERAR